MEKSFQGISPDIDASAYVAETANLVGRIRLGKNSSVWFNAVLRADFDRIVIGEGTNIQDNVCIHTNRKQPVIIGRYVTVGHGAIIHGASIGDNSLIGMGAIIQDGAKIGNNCIITPGAVVNRGRIIEDSTLLGERGEVLADIPDELIKRSIENAEDYISLSRQYQDEINC